MKDPNTALFEHWQELMASGDMTGANRPMGRVTFTEQRIRSFEGEKAGPWRSLVKSGRNEFEWEINWIANIDISRSVGEDAATCTIRIYNDSMENFKYAPQGLDMGIGRPGFKTFTRGERPEISEPSVYSRFAGVASSYPTDWGYPVSGAESDEARGWYQVFIPNRVLYTYQGYGSDNLDEMGEPRWIDADSYVKPAEDSRLIRTGVWLIDTVTFDTDGMIEVQCRDAAKLLMEQVVYPDMIPLERFPLIYCPDRAGQQDGDDGIAGPGAPGGEPESGNDPWVGHGESVYGHTSENAFDGDPDTYWLSIGNSGPQEDFAYEYITAQTQGNEINQLELHTKGSGYVVYVSVYEDGAWQGEELIPYNPDAGPAFPNQADRHYVLKTTIPKEEPQIIALPRTYRAEFVRVTFTNLWDSGLGQWPYRAAVRQMNVRWAQGEVVDWELGLDDWSSAIRELCGWAGFTWPDSGYEDPMLGGGLAVWGDFEYMGAGPIECTPPEFFLNKTFQEAINTIKDFLGCIFFVDEEGGAVFRLPNIFGGGNFIVDPASDEPRIYLRDQWPIEFHEDANLMSYTLTVDDSQVRSEVLVIGNAPDVNSEGLVAGGYVLGKDSAVDLSGILGGQNRLMLVPGDATQGFETEEECQRMAELTALQILFTLRKGNLTAPAHPGLQLDDQVRIFERITNEFNVHYVSGISTEMDLESGSYTMTVQTHWLGEDPRAIDSWFVNSQELTPAVRNLPAIIDRLGEVEGVGMTALGIPTTVVDPEED